MRRLLVFALLVGLLAGSLAGSAEARKKKKKKKPVPQSVDVTWYLRNTADSGCADEALQLMLTPGDAGGSCGSAFSGAVNEVLSRAFGEPCTPATAVGQACGGITYTATEGIPFVLDGSKNITGKIVVLSYRGAAANPGGLTAGPTTFVMTLTGSVGGEDKEIGTFSEEYVVTPASAAYEIDFEMEIDEALAGAEVSTLTATFHNRGVAPLHGFYQVNTSNITIPTLQLP